MAANDTIFKMNNVDWSAHVVAESYAVNYEPVYDEWTDGAQTKHRDVILQKLRGTFQMYFKTDTELQSFLTAWANCKSAVNTYPVHLKANNANISTLVSKNVFMDFQPVRKRDPAWNDAFDIFEVTVEEP